MENEFVKGSVAMRIVKDGFEVKDRYTEDGDDVIISEIRICVHDDGTLVTAVKEEAISLRDGRDPCCAYYVRRERGDWISISECGYFAISGDCLVLEQSDFGENRRMIDRFYMESGEGKPCKGCRMLMMDERGSYCIHGGYIVQTEASRQCVWRRSE